MPKQKLYCFVDETGQDTKGNFFLVVVILQNQEDLENLRKKLLKSEKLTKKNLLKWTRCPFKVREKFLSELTKIKELRGSVYYSSYYDSKEYIALISLTVAKAILSKEDRNYAVTVIIDGLKDKEREEVRRELKKLKIKYNKIRGMKDEQDAILRLADCISGLLRDFIENQKYAKQIYRNFKDIKIIIEV